MSAGEQPTREQVVDFVYHEALLIDERRLDEWYELYSDDALYWMPLARGQSEDDLHNALFYEDKLLLRIRVERLKSPRAFSQQPPSHCQHVLQQPAIGHYDHERGRYATRTPFVYVESKLDDQFVLSGVAHHELRIVDGALRIHRKRIELLNREAALPSVQLFP